MTHTSILRSLSLAVIGSLWQRIAHSIRVSLRLGFLGVPCGLRLCCSSVDFVSLTVPRPSIPASLPLAVIGSLWQRIALSIQASLTLAFIGAISFAGDSMSQSRNLPLCLRCRSAIAGFLWRTASLLLKRRLRLAYRPETIDSGFASARRHRVSLATYSSIDSSFANARFHRSYIFRRRQHVAVPKPTALPSLPLGNRGVSLADCVSSAQASTSSRFRRRQHVSTCDR